MFPVKLFQLPHYSSFFRNKVLFSKSILWITNEGPSHSSSEISFSSLTLLVWIWRNFTWKFSWRFFFFFFFIWLLLIQQFSHLIYERMILVLIILLYLSKLQRFRPFFTKVHLIELTFLPKIVGCWIIQVVSQSFLFQRFFKIIATFLPLFCHEDIKEIIILIRHYFTKLCRLIFFVRVIQEVEVSICDIVYLGI